jgi:hypothetical protein
MKMKKAILGLMLAMAIGSVQAETKICATVIIDGVPVTICHTL